MRLNLQTDYALRLMMHLAVNAGQLCTIAEVAERFSISRNHLMKVAHILGKNGYIETMRGRSGGLALARPAGEINIGEIVRSMEADFAVVECFQDGANGCLITPACRLKGVLNEAVEAFLAVLDQHALDDLVRRNAKLHALLIDEAA